MYKILFRSGFKRVLKKLDKQEQKRILGALEELAQDPFFHPNVRMIVGVRPKSFRLRVGRWRILYIVVTKDKILEVIDLFMRKGKDDYRDL